MDDLVLATREWVEADRFLMEHITPHLPRDVGGEGRSMGPEDVVLQRELMELVEVKRRNYVDALRAAGFPTPAVAPPRSGLSSAEYDH